MTSSDEDSPTGALEQNSSTPRSEEELLKTRARELAKVTHRVTKKVDLRTIEFLLSDMPFAFEVERLREILRNDKIITPLPFVPPYFKGLINVRGEIIPVVDLAQFLGLAEAGKRGEPFNSFIILQERDIVVAIPCAQILRMRDFSNHELQHDIAAQSARVADLAKGCGRGGIIVLDAARLVSQLQADLNSA